MNAQIGYTPCLHVLRFRNYWSMHQDTLSPWFWLGLFLGTPAAFFIGLLVERPIIVPALVAAPFVLRLIHFGVRLRSGFRLVRSLPEAVSIPIEGWDRLLASEVTQSDTHWLRDVTAEIEGGDAHERLDAFVIEANRCFYAKHGAASGAHDDPRVEWTRVGKRLSGSANLRVLGCMAELVVSLDKTKSAQRIRFTRSGTVHEVPSFGHTDMI